MYVYEFLYRGRPNGDSAYHVILGDVVDNFGQPKHVESSVLTPAQAEALGFPLPKIIEGINAAVMAERDQAVADKEAAERILETERTEKAEVESARDRALAELAAMGRERAEDAAVGQAAPPTAVRARSP